MQVYALFAVLSCMATSYVQAAPLVIGIPGIAQIDVKLPALPKVQELVLPSISLPPLPAKPTDAASAQSAIAAVIDQGKGALESIASKIGVAIPSDVAVSINTDLFKGSATAAIPVPTGVTSVNPADLLKKLGEMVGDFDKPTKASDAVTQLNKAGADLEAAAKAAVAALKSGTSYSQFLPQTAALTRNLNNFVDRLPKNVASDSAVKQAASQVDQTLAGYLKSLSSASGSTKQFGDELFKAGLNVKTITNSLLKQTSTAVPATGLSGLIPGFDLSKFA